MLEKNTESLPVLGYWNIRGNAQPIRLLLAYTKTDYVERNYTYGTQSEDDRAEWLKEKSQLGFDFPNLPYYIEGENRLTQSITILRHLAEKHGLAGSSDEERTRIDLTEQVLRDYRNRFVDATLNKNFEKSRLSYLEELPDSLRSLATFLSIRPFFGGNSISYVDFMAYEYIDQHFYLYPQLFVSFRNLKEFLSRIEALPTIHEFRYSPKYMRWPSGLLIPWYQSKFYSTFHRSDSSDLVFDQKNNIEKCQKIIENLSVY